MQDRARRSCSTPRAAPPRQAAVRSMRLRPEVPAAASRRLHTADPQAAEVAAARTPAAAEPAAAARTVSLSVNCSAGLLTGCAGGFLAASWDACGSGDPHDSRSTTPTSKSARWVAPLWRAALQNTLFTDKFSIRRRKAGIAEGRGGAANVADGAEVGQREAV